MEEIDGRARGGRTRRALLDAGRATFYEKGYQATTIPSIIERAGVDEEEAARLFRNEEDLFIELVRETFTEIFEEAFSSGPSPPGTYDERLTHVSLRAVISVYARHGGLWRPLLEGALSSPAVEAAWFAHRLRVRDELVSLVARMQDAGLVRPMDPVLCVEGLIGMVEWFAMSRSSFDAAGPLREDQASVDALFDLWVHALDAGS